MPKQLGFDSVWILDHQLIESDTPGWEGVEHGAWDCWSILAAIAASTSRIELGPFVSNTLLRNPALTAKMADTRRRDFRWTFHPRAWRRVAPA